MTKNIYIKWMHIVLSREIQHLSKIKEDILTLNHQIENYENMSSSVQEAVRDELKSRMLELGWEKEVDEVFRDD